MHKIDTNPLKPRCVWKQAFNYPNKATLLLAAYKDGIPMEIHNTGIMSLELRTNQLGPRDSEGSKCCEYQYI